MSSLRAADVSFLEARSAGYTQVQTFGATGSIEQPFSQLLLLSNSFPLIAS